MLTRMESRMVSQTTTLVSKSRGTDIGGFSARVVFFIFFLGEGGGGI